VRGFNGCAAARSVLIGDHVAAVDSALVPERLDRIHFAVGGREVEMPWSVGEELKARALKAPTTQPIAAKMTAVGASRPVEVAKRARCLPWSSCSSTGPATRTKLSRRACASSAARCATRCTTAAAAPNPHRRRLSAASAPGRETLSSLRLGLRSRSAIVSRSGLYLLSDGRTLLEQSTPIRRNQRLTGDKKMSATPHLLHRLRAEGFDVSVNQGGRYFPVRAHGQVQRIGEAQLKANGDEVLWLKDADSLSANIFTRTNSQTWKGGRCVATDATIEACVSALHHAAVRRPPTA
jgi:hypothetical protein